MELFQDFLFFFQNNQTPLHMTCQEIDLDNFSEELLKFGANLNAVDVEGHSAIHFCALYGRNETAKILVS